MMNYDERDPDLDGPECISLSLAGKLIAVLEIFCYVFGYYYFEDYFGGDQEKLIILATILGLMTLFSISLLCGVVKSNRLFITPWIWVKGTLIFLQVLRFVSLVVDLSLQEKVGTAPLYELLFFGKSFELMLRFETL